MSFRIIHQQKGKSSAQIIIESKKAEEMTKAQLLVVGQKTKDNMYGTVIAEHSSVWVGG